MWLHLLDSFFLIKSIDEISAIPNQYANEGFILGKSEDLLIFLIKGEQKAKSIVKTCFQAIKSLSYPITTSTYILVLNPSIKGISFIFFFAIANRSSDLIKIIHFPRGLVPAYFQEIVRTRSVQRSHPLELLQELFNIPALEADFIKCMKEKIMVSKPDLRIQLILHVSLLLIFSRFMFSDDFLDWLRNESIDYKYATLQDCIARIPEFDAQQVAICNEISELKRIINDKDLYLLPMNLSLIQDFLKRYSYSLREPTAFIQEVAINPSVLSELTKNLFNSSSSNKKKGKYYTSAINADFISYLAIYRLFVNKLISVSSDDLFTWVYQDWGLVEMEPMMSLDPLLIKNSPIKVLDPSCGTGSFLLSVSRLLCRLADFSSISNNRTFPIVELIGIDQDEIAVLVTRIRLILLKIYELSKLSSECAIKRKYFPINWKFCDIIHGDFFNHKEIYKKNYDLILGNPPWVRHEDIGAAQAPEYKELIQSQIRELSNTKIYFDQKSDLYVYFCLMGLSLLKNNGGVFAFLTSNAWLEVKYGQTLQKFLLDPDKQLINFDIIHRSGKRLWEKLGINSIILIVEKSSDEQAKISNGTFTEIKVNFSQIPPSSLKKGVISRREYKDRYCRTELIPLNSLKNTHKWAGIFLRMSHSEREILRSIENKGVPLSHLADVRFGIKTGANDFFHLQCFESQHTDGKVFVKNRIGYEGFIEAKYLVPLIKSPSHIQGFVILSSFKSSQWLFYCLDSPAQLQGTEAWKYIKWGENTRVTIKQGKKSGKDVIGFSSFRSVKQRDYWYSIGNYPTPSLLWTKSYHNKSGCFYNQAEILPDQRFYGIIVKQYEYLPLIFTFLNSSLVWAQMEVRGNTNMGFGVLDTNVYWLREVKIPIEAMVEKKQIRNLMVSLIHEENRCSMLEYSKIRAEIDRFYAKYLGVSDSSMKHIYKFIKRSIKNRLQ